MWKRLALLLFSLIALSSFVYAVDCPTDIANYTTLTGDCSTTVSINIHDGGTLDCNGFTLSGTITSDNNYIVLNGTLKNCIVDGVINNNNPGQFAQIQDASIIDNVKLKNIVLGTILLHTSYPNTGVTQILNTEISNITNGNGFFILQFPDNVIVDNLYMHDIIKTSSGSIIGGFNEQGIQPTWIIKNSNFTDILTTGTMIDNAYGPVNISNSNFVRVNGTAIAVKIDNFVFDNNNVDISIVPIIATPFLRLQVTSPIGNVAITNNRFTLNNGLPWVISVSPSAQYNVLINNNNVTGNANRFLVSSVNANITFSNNRIINYLGNDSLFNIGPGQINMFGNIFDNVTANTNVFLFSNNLTNVEWYNNKITNNCRGITGGCIAISTGANLSIHDSEISNINLYTTGNNNQGFITASASVILGGVFKFYNNNVHDIILFNSSGSGSGKFLLRSEVSGTSPGFRVNGISVYNNNFTNMRAGVISLATANDGANITNNRFINVTCLAQDNQGFCANMLFQDNDNLLITNNYFENSSGRVEYAQQGSSTTGQQNNTFSNNYIKNIVIGWKINPSSFLYGGPVLRGTGGVSNNNTIEVDFSNSLAHGTFWLHCFSTNNKVIVNSPSLYSFNGWQTSTTFNCQNINHTNNNIIGPYTYTTSVAIPNVNISVTNNIFDLGGGPSITNMNGANISFIGNTYIGGESIDAADIFFSLRNIVNASLPTVMTLANNNIYNASFYVGDIELAAQGTRNSLLDVYGNYYYYDPSIVFNSTGSNTFAPIIGIQIGNGGNVTFHNNNLNGRYVYTSISVSSNTSLLPQASVYNNNFNLQYGIIYPTYSDSRIPYNLVSFYNNVYTGTKDVYLVPKSSAPSGITQFAINLTQANTQDFYPVASKVILSNANNKPGMDSSAFRSLFNFSNKITNGTNTTTLDETYLDYNVSITNVRLKQPILFASAAVSQVDTLYTSVTESLPNATEATVQFVTEAPVLTNVTNLTVAESGGSNNIIQYPPNESINLVTVPATAVVITPLSISVDTVAAPALDIPARLTFNNIPGDYRILRNGNTCPNNICSNIVYNNKVLSFDVTGFSTFSIDLPTAQGCSNTRDIVFAAFAIIAIIVIVSAAFLLIQFSGDFSAFLVLAISSIGLAIVLFVGYIVISAVQNAICVV